MNIANHKTFCIADLGCSCGPNTLLAAETIVKAVERKYGNEGIRVPEIQVFFNDLPSNDFNSVFESICDSAQPGLWRSSCFAAGVPGSFHGRLFPKDTLHFVHSSSSMHWLSKVPDEVADRNNEAWNKGKVFVSLNSSPAISQAYLRQFYKDFNAFLTARAQELVVGARMFLIFLGRAPDSDPSNQGHHGVFWNALGNALNDLVSQGMVEEEKVDSFNLPLFAPSPEEVRNAVVAEGSFSIKRLEILEVRSPNRLTEKTVYTGGEGKEVEMQVPIDYAEYGRFVATHLRAVSESLLEFQFGAEVMDALFDRFAHIIAEMAKDGSDHTFEHEILLVVVLERQN